MTTWNPADFQNMSFSGGNLTATGSGTGSSFTRGTTSKASGGKVYWEITLGSTMGTFGGIGGSNENYLVSQNIPGWDSGANSFAIMASTGDLRIANIIVAAVQFEEAINGDILGLAWDMTADKFWLLHTRIGVTVGPGWNNSGTANPATGVSGVGIVSNGMNAGTSLFAICGTVNGTEVFTLNPGASALIAAMPPSGFSMWDASVGGTQTRDTAGRADFQKRVNRGSASRVTRWTRNASRIFVPAKDKLWLPRPTLAGA